MTEYSQLRMISWSKWERWETWIWVL